MANENQDVPSKMGVLFGVIAALIALAKAQRHDKDTIAEQKGQIDSLTAKLATDEAPLTDEQQGLLAEAQNVLAAVQPPTPEAVQQAATIEATPPAPEGEQSQAAPTGTT